MIQLHKIISTNNLTKLRELPIRETFFTEDDKNLLELFIRIYEMIFKQIKDFKCFSLIDFEKLPNEKNYTLPIISNFNIPYNYTYIETVSSTKTLNLFLFCITPDNYFMEKLKNILIIEQENLVCRFIVFPFMQVTTRLDIAPKPTFTCFPIYEENKDNTSLMRISAVTLESMYKAVTSEEDANRSFHVLAHNVMDTMYSLLTILECKNITTRLHTPDKGYNKKRLKKGLTPAFEYRTLCINDKATGSKKERLSISDKNSPRLHWRRGHIRHYQDGSTTWVRQALVGSSDIGAIIKDYKVGK